MKYLSIIKKPLLTEKTTQLTDTNNIYCFEVGVQASKTQIKFAVAELFDVKVLKVSTVVCSKRKRSPTGRASSVFKLKKAYVKIEPGQKIELFKTI
jgi:large subunit ribosomal protein L23